jgi:hypothetical protein
MNDQRQAEKQALSLFVGDAKAVAAKLVEAAERIGATTPATDPSAVKFIRAVRECRKRIRLAIHAEEQSLRLLRSASTPRQSRLGLVWLTAAIWGPASLVDVIERGANEGDILARVEQRLKEGSSEEASQLRLLSFLAGSTDPRALNDLLDGADNPSWLAEEAVVAVSGLADDLATKRVIDALQVSTSPWFVERATRILEQVSGVSQDSNSGWLHWFDQKQQEASRTTARRWWEVWRPK